MDHQTGSSNSKMSRSFRFMPQEVNEMEEQLKPLSDCKSDRVLMSELAVMFSHSRERDGMVPVTAQQVLNWFHNRRYSKSRTKMPLPHYRREKLAPRRAKLAIPDAQQQDAGSSAIGNNPLVRDPGNYEAKSTRDGSWYNVQQFLSNRLCESGDWFHEVKVQLSGFGSEQVEWINTRTCLRQRSLPCKATDCVTVACRDIVLCYKNGHYFDAKVDAIARKRHDSSACDCRFLVIYQHDKSEEIVPLRKLSLRPDTLNNWVEKQKPKE